MSVTVHGALHRLTRWLKRCFYEAVKIWDATPGSPWRNTDRVTGAQVCHFLSSLTRAAIGSLRHSPARARAHARTHTRRLQSNVTLSLVHQWGRAVRHTGLLGETGRLPLLSKLCIIHTSSLLPPCFDARCTTQIGRDFVLAHLRNSHTWCVFFLSSKYPPNFFRFIDKMLMLKDDNKTQCYYFMTEILKGHFTNKIFFTFSPSESQNPTKQWQHYNADWCLRRHKGGTFMNIFFKTMIFSVPGLAPGAVSRRVWPRGVSWLVQGVMSMHCDSWDKVYGCVWWE